MKHTLLLAAILLVALVASFSCCQAERATKYHRQAAPQTGDWRYISRAESDSTVTFTLALKQQNVDVLEQMLYADSDPASPVYGQHKTKEEIMRVVAPSVEVQNQVIDWINKETSALGEAHLKNLVNQQDSILLTTSVALAEKIFNTELHIFFNIKKKGAVIKHLGDLSVPVEVSEHIELITGITEFPPTAMPFRTKSNSNAAGDSNKCNVAYSLKNLYSVPTDLVVTNKNVTQGIYAIESPGYPEGFGEQTLSYFETANGVTQNQVTCIRGNNAASYSGRINDDVEAHLDIQMSVGMAQGVQICFYTMEYGQGWMYEFANYVLQEYDAPWVISMSYGWLESEQCSTSQVPFVGNCSYLHIPNSEVYVQRTNTEFMKLGLLGHTLLAAAGDDGTSGTHGTSDYCKTLGPIFPAASPYVTTVGATSVESSATETKANAGSAPPICTDASYRCDCSTSTVEAPALSTNTAGFDTGGGFSQVTAMPAYQAAAVNAYLESGVTLPSSTLFNQSNRGFPDIGAVGEQICLLSTSGPCSFVGGSSASTPLIASLVTLLNQDRINAGKTPLGFINPLIYTLYGQAASTYFNTQFTSGNNKGSCPASHGFNANPKGGWNPLVGVGSPKFDAIRQYVATLP